MAIELLECISNHLGGIMTGLTMAVIGVAVYEARDGFFLFRGQFQGKYSALVIFLATLFGASLLTPSISGFWAQHIPRIPPGQLLGTILVLGMLGVNKAAEWNLFDSKSIVIYGVGTLLILKPELLSTVA